MVNVMTNDLIFCGIIYTYKDGSTENQSTMALGADIPPV